MFKVISKLIIWLCILVTSFTLFVFIFLRNPIFYHESNKLPVSIDANRLAKDVRYLASMQPTRNPRQVASLNQAAGYIKTEFDKSSCDVTEQVFQLEGQDFKNVICSFGPKDAPRVIIGAHYDVDNDYTPGADDNASGVAGVLELARLIAKNKPSLKHRVDLIAYTLEETAYLEHSSLGSYTHAKALKENNVDVRLMISVEMIGYFSDQEGSQHYPLNFLKWLYPSKGNFIGVVGLSMSRAIVRRAKSLMIVSPEMPVYSINAPNFIPGIGLSDHKNYWLFDYPALMVTDTAFNRNPHYHKATDTPDTLDYDRMALVVEGLYQVAVKF